MQTEIMNAVIERATITNDDYGVLSSWITLTFGGSAQGFGGYSLYRPKDFTHSMNQKNYCGHFIWRVMEIAGVTEWGQLRGKCIRVRKPNGWSGTIEAIGHIIKDDWFDPKKDFAEMK